MWNIEVSEAILYLGLYSVIGWICASFYCSIPEKKFINKGFLRGPYCPVYGMGAVLIVTVTKPFQSYPILILLLSVFIVAVLEYITGWLMEFIFQIRWWDYSKKRFHLHGRICLQNSLLFGFLGMVSVYILHPLAIRIIEQIPKNNYRAIKSVIIAFVFIDLLSTLSELLKLTDLLKTIQDCLVKLDQYSENYSWFQKDDFKSNYFHLKKICDENQSDENLVPELKKPETLIEKLQEYSNMQKRARLVCSFPGLSVKAFDNWLDSWRSFWEQYQINPSESWYRQVWKSVKRISKKLAVNVKNALKTFVSGLNPYKLFWVFVIGGVFGYVVETIYCLIQRGVLESRQGLLYGPFSQIYGFGAVVMIMILEPLLKKDDRWLFIGGALVGGAFEYIASVFQEFAFGTVSWNYSKQVFSIGGGRTSLTYMFFWGILSIVFMKIIYPKLSDLIERMPIRQGRFFSSVLKVLLIIDLSLTVSALYRWSLRIEKQPPANTYEIFLDEHYTDERMQKIYPNMRKLTGEERNHPPN